MIGGGLVGLSIAIIFAFVLAAFFLLADPSIHPPRGVGGWLAALIPPALLAAPVGVVFGVVLGGFASLMWREK